MIKNAAMTQSTARTTKKNAFIGVHVPGSFGIAVEYMTPEINKPRVSAVVPASF